MVVWTVTSNLSVFGRPLIFVTQIKTERRVGPDNMTYSPIQTRLRIHCSRFNPLFWDYNKKEVTHPRDLFSEMETFRLLLSQTLVTGRKRVFLWCVSRLCSYLGPDLFPVRSCPYPPPERGNGRKLILQRGCHLVIGGLYFGRTHERFYNLRIRSGFGWPRLRHHHPWSLNLKLFEEIPK